jgi:hypothetical protein
MREWLTFERGMILLQFLATAALGVFAGLIAYRQARTASDKLKFDLFDRRFEIYRLLMAFLEDIQENVLSDDNYTFQVRKIIHGRFLFGPDVNEWLDRLFKDTRRMNNARRTMENVRPDGGNDLAHQEHIEASKAYAELTMRIDAEIERAQELFKPYLDFGKNL